MPGLLGIDHPLIAVRAIEPMRERYAALGFRMTPVSLHPWGTCTSVAVFRNCLLELMGIDDESLIDQHPAGGFRFGRVVRDQLAEREGVSLLALHSTDADADAAAVQARGLVCQGGIEFGRDIVLPDGRPERTATSLRVLYDPDLPRLSNFICQQHRRELIEVPAWLEHPNGATGICQVTVLASPSDHPRVRSRMAGLYGEAALVDMSGGFAVRTGNGAFVVCGLDAVEAAYGLLPAALAGETQPCCVAVHVRVPSLDGVLPILEREAVDLVRRGERVTVGPAEAFGNVFIVFDAAAA